LFGELNTIYLKPAQKPSVEKRFSKFIPKADSYSFGFGSFIARKSPAAVNNMLISIGLVLWAAGALCRRRGNHFAFVYFPSSFSFEDDKV
jgi:hypothetical protein